MIQNIPEDESPCQQNTRPRAISIQCKSTFTIALQLMCSRYSCRLNNSSRPCSSVYSSLLAVSTIETGICNKRTVLSNSALCYRPVLLKCMLKLIKAFIKILLLKISFRRPKVKLSAIKLYFKCQKPSRYIEILGKQIDFHVTLQFEFIFIYLPVSVYRQHLSHNDIAFVQRFHNVQKWQVAKLHDEVASNAVGALCARTLQSPRTPSRGDHFEPAQGQRRGLAFAQCGDAGKALQVR